VGSPDEMFVIIYLRYNFMACEAIQGPLIACYWLIPCREQQSKEGHGMRLCKMRIFKRELIA